jgi:hypothetical protein
MRFGAGGSTTEAESGRRNMMIEASRLRRKPYESLASSGNRVGGACRHGPCATIKAQDQRQVRLRFHAYAALFCESQEKVRPAVHRVRHFGRLGKANRTGVRTGPIRRARDRRRNIRHDSSSPLRTGPTLDRSRRPDAQGSRVRSLSMHGLGRDPAMSRVRALRRQRACPRARGDVGCSYEGPALGAVGKWPAAPARERAARSRVCAG